MRGCCQLPGLSATWGGMVLLGVSRAPAEFRDTLLRERGVVVDMVVARYLAVLVVVNEGREPHASRQRAPRYTGVDKGKGRAPVVVG